MNTCIDNILLHVIWLVYTWLCFAIDVSSVDGSYMLGKVRIDLIIIDIWNLTILDLRQYGKSRLFTHLSERGRLLIDLVLHEELLWNLESKVEWHEENIRGCHYEVRFGAWALLLWYVSTLVIHEVINGGQAFITYSSGY